MKYLMKHLAKKRIPLFSIAPAIGFTKKEEDHPELQNYLRNVLPEINDITRDNGLILGIHSGDGKTKETRRLIGDITEGSVWHKVSPDRQRTFFQFLAESADGSDEKILFDEIFQYLHRMVRQGVESDEKDFVDNCRQSLTEFKKRPSQRPAAACRMFYDFGFLAVRPFRLKLDLLSENFAKRYYEADFQYIKDLAESLGWI